jgi:hypothetical protein
MDVRKTVTDAGYIAIGLGVMGFQQVQVRAQQVQEHLGATRACVAGRAKDASERLTAHGVAIETKTREARDKAEEQVTITVIRVQGLAGELTNRVEPLFVQVQATVADLPEKVVQAIEPMAALVRERIRPAA